jgi:hypothetical protein
VEPGLQVIALRLPERLHWAAAQSALADVGERELRQLPLADLAPGWAELPEAVRGDGEALRAALAGDLDAAMRALTVGDPHLALLRPRGDERILLVGDWSEPGAARGLPAAFARLVAAGLLRAAGMVPVTVLGRPVVPGPDPAGGDAAAGDPA